MSLPPPPGVRAAPPVKWSFLSVPQEVAEHVLKFCHARDVAKFAETCREMHDLIYNGSDKYLWRELFLLHPFDDPRLAVAYGEQIPADSIDWRGELQRRVRTERVLRDIDISLNPNGDYVSQQLAEALNTLVSAVRTASSAAPENGQEESYNVTWVTKVLKDSPVLDDTSLGDPLADTEVCQLQALLRCFLGLSHQDGESEESNAHLQAIRTASRCYVYDLRNYTEKTSWGPYMVIEKSGEVVVNWKHLEDIMNVIIMNTREVPNHWDDIWPQWGIESTRAYSAPNTRNRKPHDWAGVEGLWRRVVCFMDYRDLFAFNFTTIHHGPLSADYFLREARFAEAVRIMEYELKIKEIEAPVGESDDEEFPTIHFEGVCRGAHRSKGLVKGTVSMFAPGVIKWTFVTAYDGTANSWSAEAVQVGNVGSAVGMGGIWTVAVHEDVGDPAGPFWMWKVDEPLPRDMFMIPMY